MERPTFSQNWSRVSRLTPTLRPHVQMTRQLFRGEPWYVVHDPISNNFFRLNPVAHHFIGLLDGKRTVDEAWTLTMDRYADAAPTQNESVHLLGQLNQSNLLRVDLPVDAQPLLERARRRKMGRWTGQAMSILFIKIPLFNPNQMLDWLTPLAKPLLNKVGLILWAIWLIYCGLQFGPHLGAFIHNAESVLSPTNWGWMILLFIVTKAIHELGHGLVCKHLGGAVPEVGIMMLIMMPAPYVDATSSWSFSSRWQRFLVSAAGMMFELAIAGGAALVWLYETQHNPGSLTQQLAYNIVFLASITTILFNANPLLRFDGYYMLADFLEVPNMYDRATKHIQWIIQRYAYGLENAMPVSTSQSEQWILLGYGITSQVYRLFVLTGIILFISGQLLTLGLLLAAWSFIAWALVPLGKLIRWLFTSPFLIEHRIRAVGVTVVTLAIFLGVVGLLPVDEHKRTEGVVQSAVRMDIAVQTDGFVSEVLVSPGEKITQGQIMIRAENPSLRSRQAELKAELVRLTIEQRKSLVEDPVATRITKAQAQAIHEELNDLEHRIDSLILRSPQTGILIGQALNELQGQYLTRGQVIARVVDLKQLRITALVSQSQSAAAFFKNIRQVECRLAGNLPVTFESELLKAFDSGRNYLPHPALGQHGGGQIAMDAQDSQGRRTLRPQFEMWLKLPEQTATSRALLGQRVYIRFTLPKRPLLWQWITKAKQVIQDRLQL